MSLTLPEAQNVDLSPSVLVAVLLMNLTMVTGASPKAWGRTVIRPSNRPWTVEEVRDRIADAADTLRRLPKPPGLERSLQSPWPDTLREWLQYGYDRTQVRRAAPSPEAIDRLDEVLGWLSPSHLSATQRMVLWAREGERMPWPRISSFCDAQVNRGKGRSARWLRVIKGDAEARILSRLNGTPYRARRASWSAPLAAAPGGEERRCFPASAA